MACSSVVPRQSLSSYGSVDHPTLLLSLCGDKDAPLSLYFTISPTYIKFFPFFLFNISKNIYFKILLEMLVRLFTVDLLIRVIILWDFLRNICEINLANFWWDSLFTFVIFYYLKWYSILFSFLLQFLN